ncbi:MAG: DUF3750 domain-containing protein [Cyclobacteriaceae bacterium]
MDRNLNDKERVRNQKSSKASGNRIYGPIKLSYRFLFTRTLFIVFLLAPLIVDHWTRTDSAPRRRNESRGFAPDPNKHTEPVLQVYAARTWGLKGMFAVHSWIAMKPRGAKRYEVSQVIGWRKDRIGNVLFRENIVPDKSWYGNEPTLLLDLRGDQVESIISKVDAAIKEYPWAKEYEIYPGPNSNTFVAWIGLKVPELGLDLPSTAIGKDWRPLEHSLGLSASGTGVQASLLGLLGTSIGIEEGLELNILGLNIELDLFDLSVEMPFFGRFGKWYVLSYLALLFSLRAGLKEGA